MFETTNQIYYYGGASFGPAPTTTTTTTPTSDESTRLRSFRQETAHGRLGLLMRRLTWMASSKIL